MVFAYDALPHIGISSPPSWRRAWRWPATRRVIAEMLRAGVLGSTAGQILAGNRRSA